MKFLKYFLVAVIALFGVGRSQAQCNISYSLGYNVYTSAQVAPGTNVNSNSPVLYNRVISQGSASMYLANYNCPDSFRTSIQNAINNATHYLGVYNNVTGNGGSNGGWQYGSSLCASCWNDENNFIASALVPGLSYQWNIGTYAICSVGGPMAFFQFPGGAPTLAPGLLELVEVARTWTKIIGPPVAGAVPVTPWCSNTTSPDWNPAILAPYLWEPGASVQWGFAFCYRQPTWKTFVCTPGPSTAIHPVYPTVPVPKGYCTNNHP